MSKIHPFVYFIGKAEFKTEMPKNVMNRGLISYFKNFNELIISEEEMLDIVDKVGSMKIDMTLNHATHMRSLKKRHESTITCPKCGSPLIKRVSKKSSHGGESFLGCTAYPKCRYIKK